MVKNPGPYKVPNSLNVMFLVFVAVGAVVFGASVATDPLRAWASFVQNHFFFLSLALGGAFFAAIQWVTGAMWSAPVRRIAESYTAYLPVAMVTFIGLYFGIHHLYGWSHAEHVTGDLVLEGKAPYLNVSFFVIRNLVAFAIWIYIAWKMVCNSIEQDKTGSYALTEKNKVLSPVFLIVFALTFTMASFDTIMSLDPHWFSTIFGVYCFAGLFYSTLALTCVLAIYLRDQGYLKDIVNDNHIHDLGKFMFAFTIFWAYIAFSQFMLIWYANLPEETGYYIKRFEGPWLNVSIFLLVGKFFFPFFFLLPRDVKRNSKRLVFIGVFMLVAQWIDVLWMVQPQFFKVPMFGWIEAGVTLGFIGLFGLCVLRFLGKYSLVAVGDPRLHESVLHHHV
jgi:hypothetical protein